MALLEKDLLVKRSSLPNSGKGLFTKVAIAKGTRIVEYKGKKTIWKKVKDDDGKNGYIFYITRNCVIDAWPTTQHLGRYANDARGAVKMNGTKNNSEYVVDGKRCFITAVKSIPAKSEIFVGYGAEYWKVMKKNWKVEEEEKNEKKSAKKPTSKKKKKAGKTAKKKK